ncbi:29311_t:CDS:2 [Racocetra persica]|uniref:29311_t:CDS:1 n=1 Tax=Racocetra persica TaxID=160502 RepID=A0ACA9LJ00_9GLOM|nr:29311_t:CDS:2 [Racocetra persica]
MEQEEKYLGETQRRKSPKSIMNYPNERGPTTRLLDECLMELNSKHDMVTSCLRKGNSFVTGQRSIKSKIEQIKNEPGFYQRAPFLTIAKELLSLVKQNKVEVTFLSAFDKRVFANGDPRKKQIFSETFGKYPNCSLNLVGFDSEGQGQTKGE